LPSLGLGGAERLAVSLPMSGSRKAIEET